MPALLPITIRPEHPTDHAATEALALAALAPDERVAELVRRLRHSPALITEVNLIVLTPKVDENNGSNTPLLYNTR